MATTGVTTITTAPITAPVPQGPYRLPNAVGSEVSITLAIIPPSRPLTPQHEDDQPESPDASQNLFPTPPITRTRRGSLSPSVDLATDDDITCVNSAATSVTDISLASNISDIVSPDTTIYHIYRNGTSNNNLSIHTVKDSTVKKIATEPDDPPVAIDRRSATATRSRVFKNRNHKIPRKKKKKIKLEDPEMDPRKATYYMHTPVIFWHCPPQTLRFGPNKTAPVVCLIKGSWFWRTWRMDFVVPEKDPKKSGKQKRVDSGFAEDSKDKSEKEWKGLNEPGVIDPRGVLASEYPLRPLGHIKGESGKKFMMEHAERRKAAKAAKAASEPQLRRAKSFSDTARRIFRVNTASSTSKFKSKDKVKVTTELIPTEEEKIESMLPPSPNPEDLPDHLKPETLEEGSLLMTWTGWRTIRDYVFKWRGVDFVWKGTATVRDERKHWGSLSRFNHLKLVARIPEEPAEEGEERREEGDGGSKDAEEEQVDKISPEALLRRQSSFSSFVSLITRRNSNTSQSPKSGESKGYREVVIAKYTCLLAKRKCGRLTIYEKALRETANVNLEGTDPDVARERLRHVVVATGLCMLEGEKQKRDTLKRIAESAVSEAAGAAG